MKKSRIKLSQVLSNADDDSFLQLVWAVHRLQSNRPSDVSKYLNYPNEAATSDLSSSYIVHKWELETLVILLLTTSKHQNGFGSNYKVDCRQFQLIAAVSNMLRSLEDSESAAELTQDTVLSEIHRIGHREFEWQQGFATLEKVYRYMFVYGQGLCSEYFKEEHGITVEQFLHTSFRLLAILINVPWIKITELEKYGLGSDILEAALRLLSKPLSDLRNAADTQIKNIFGDTQIRIAYLPSILRKFPIITEPKYQTVISPLPELIIHRATAGLYFDMREGGQELIADANQRFEKYTQKITKGYFPNFNFPPKQNYGLKGKKRQTPDVLVETAGEIAIIIECKATKLTFDAQFAENPFEKAEHIYNQLVKGVVQLWKFFSDGRRGIFKSPISAKAHAMLVSMDPFTQLSDELQNEIISRAKKSLIGDENITNVDMRTVTFCSIQELVVVMRKSDEHQFLATLKQAELPEFAGWGLVSARKRIHEQDLNKPFPLDISELLPWWKTYTQPIEK